MVSTVYAHSIYVGLLDLSGPDDLEQMGGILAPYRAPPPFAFFIWYGNKSMLVQHVDQRSSGKKASTLKICIYSSLLLSDSGMNSLSRVLFKP